MANKIHLYLLLADGVVAPRIVVSSVLLSCDHAARVEKVPVGSCPDLKRRLGMRMFAEYFPDQLFMGVRNMTVTTIM